MRAIKAQPEQGEGRCHGRQPNLGAADIPELMRLVQRRRTDPRHRHVDEPGRLLTGAAARSGDPSRPMAKECNCGHHASV